MRPTVHGTEVDAQTRCVHYYSALDVIAIKMKCCGTYYACKDCHDALAGHAIEVWPLSGRYTSEVPCRVCGTVMSIQEYAEAARSEDVNDFFCDGLPFSRT